MVLTRFLVFQLLNGITFAALLFLLSSGFTLIFGLMRVINLTHGALYLVGGYIGLTFIRFTGSFFIGVFAAAILIGILGVFIERGLLRFVRGEVLPQVLLTIGLAFIMADMSLVIWGGDPVSIPVPEFLSGSFILGNLTYPKYRLFVVLVSVVVAIGLWYLQAKTHVGTIIRAGVDDTEGICFSGDALDDRIQAAAVAAACDNPYSFYLCHETLLSGYWFNV